MKLFQYWDTGSPPDEVAGWIEGFRSLNPELEHRLFDRDSAAWFIRKHAGEREQRAFEACAVPAMQADYFRLCALVTQAGLYADADFVCNSPLADLLAQAPSALAMVWNDMMTPGFLMVRRRQDAFFSACLKLATENIEARRFGVYLATGPGVLNAVRAVVEPSWPPKQQVPWPGWPKLKAFAEASVSDRTGVLASVRGMTLMHYLAVQRWIGTPEAAYKSTSVHWHGWSGSIYNEPAAEPVRPGGGNT